MFLGFFLRDKGCIIRKDKCFLSKKGQLYALEDRNESIEQLILLY
jgi:hypothetical protein